MRPELDSQPYVSNPHWANDNGNAPFPTPTCLLQQYFYPRETLEQIGRGGGQRKDTICQTEPYRLASRFFSLSKVIGARQGVGVIRAFLEALSVCLSI